MITENVRQFVLSDYNSLLDIRMYTPYSIDNNLFEVQEWSSKFFSEQDLQEKKTLFQQAIITAKELEDPHKQELKKLAVEATSMFFGKDVEDLLSKDNVELDLGLNEKPLKFNPPEQQEQNQELDVNKFENWITRRRLLHGITACVGLKSGLDLHKLVKTELDSLDNRLSELYNSIGIGTLISTYCMPPEMVLSLYNAGDKGQVKMDNATSIEFTNEGLKLNATATSFNMLLHELTKGILNCFMMTTVPIEIEDNENLLTQFYNKSDKLIEEYFHFSCSMFMYMNLYKWTIENDLAFLNVFERLCLADPEYVIEFLDLIYNEDYEDLDYLWNKKLIINYS